MTLPTNEQFDELDELHARILGRSKFCRCRGEVKTPDLLDECAAQHIADAKRIAELEAVLTEARRAIGSHAAPDARLVPVEQLDRWMGYTSQHGGAANCLKEIRAIIRGQP